MVALTIADKIRDFIDANLTSDMRNNGALDLDEFAKKIGISKIKLATFNRADVSGLLKKERGEWNIYVKHTDSPRRRRFTIAHEIGHFISFLQDGKSKEILKDKEQVSDLAFTRAAPHSHIEAEANAIAAYILMPEGDVRELVEKSETAEEMAKHFQVSESAMLVRLNSLGIIPFETYGQEIPETEQQQEQIKQS